MTRRCGLSDEERRRERGAFWGSIHGTLNHILWGDTMWMSRFDGWEKPAPPIKQSGGLQEDFLASCVAPGRRPTAASPTGRGV